MTPEYIVKCGRCGSSFPRLPCLSQCSRCGGVLTFQYPPSAHQSSSAESIWKYRRLLPVHDTSKIVSLGEGNTPLLPSRIYRDRNIFLKNETTNPTGSHKDRSLSISITKAIEFGFGTCMLYSDGSAALSSAAYAARAGIRNITVTPAGAPDSRLLPLLIYGSLILEYQGKGADALNWVHETCLRLGIYETTTYRRANPYGAEGPKTISYEIVDDLSSVPDFVVVPIGGGGTLSGVWRGFVDLKQAGITRKLPRLVGVLPAGYKLLQLGLQHGVTTSEGLQNLADFDLPVSGQAKLAMALPPDGIEAIQAIRDSGGTFIYASDQEALLAQKRLGKLEGIYAEISASVAIVAIDTMIQQSMLKPDDTVVGLICGSGFRETGELARTMPVEKTMIYPDTGTYELEKLLRAGHRNHD